MDQPAAPWRALEEGGSTAGSDARHAANADGSAGRTSPGASWLFVVFGVAAIVAGAAVWLVATNGAGSVVVEGGGPGPARSDGGRSTPGGSPATGAAGDVVVDVQGAVVRPGIVHLPAGSRVADAIAAAGGYGPRVATDRVGQALNLAALVKDGDQVIVPSRDDSGPAPTAGTTGGGTSGGGTSGGSGPIDLNHATLAELDGLPGIGPVTAAKIIAARDEQAFGSVDDLRTRKILGAATFDKVKDLVVVR
jgi:competence protein ComEA